MKTRLPIPQFFVIILLFALSPAPRALSQVPQGFNYQAIVRDDGTNQPIVSQPVLIRITIENGIGTDLYQETHSLSTDEFGIVSIIIGQGTPWVTSDFNEIDWNDEPLKLKTEVQYPVGGSYTVMGTAPLMSVPYAMVADSLGGPLKNLKVKGSATTPDTEALFEVKNTSGQTVFAVYNEGVRIYVNDIDAKGAKGGFAIGGFGTTDKTIPHEYLFISGDSVRVYIDNTDADKGPKGGFAIGGFGTAKAGPQQFLTVSNDSVRIYVDNNETDKGPKGGFAIGGYGADKGKPQKLLTVSNDSVRIYINDAAKGPKGGFAIGGFDQAKGDGANINFFNIETDNTGIVSPAEPRVLWYPLKNAFLAGQVLILKPDSVGLNSVATGYESRAKGAQSQAMGYKAIARGDYSTAIGKNALARKANSFAFGDAAKAYNQDSYAFGAFTEAQGLGSFAFGYVGRDSLGPTGAVTKALGDYSFAFGLGAQTGSTAEGAFAIGSGTSATGKFSLAMGYKSTASDFYSVAIGNQAQATQSSSAIGYYATATGKYSVSLLGTASGTRSISIGDFSEASAISAIAIGGYYYHTDVPNVTNWHRARATGVKSIAIGNGVGALGDYSVSIGTGTYGDLVIPPAISYGKAAADYSYSIGTWNNSDGTGAFAIGSYNTSSGNDSYAIGYHANTSGSNSVSIGNYTTSSGQYATAIGNNLTAQTFNSFVVGRYNAIEGTTGSWNGYEPLFVVGNGSSTSDRRNAFSVRQDGFTESQGMLKVKGWSIPAATGAGIEIHYSSGEGTISAYDRGAGTSMPLNINSIIHSVDIEPQANNTYYLGSPSKLWREVFAVKVTTPSDLRLKDNISVLSGYLATVMRLNPVSFTWKNESDSHRTLGLIAQEVLPLIPEVVSIGDDPDNTMGINYSGLVPVLISAIKEQQEQIDELKKLVDELLEK